MHGLPCSRSITSFLALVGYVAFALIATGRLSGAIYDYDVNDGSGRALRLNIPDDLTTVRGILSWGNGGTSDSRPQATDEELMALARAHGFCVLATSGFAFYTPDAYQVYLTGIERLATMSGHSELTQVPWLPFGHSNGGIMSYDLTVANPGRTIAFAVTKAGAWADSRPSLGALGTPGMLIAGELDTAIRIVTIRDLFDGNRPRGALWAWAEEGGIGHDSANEDDMIRSFAEDVLNFRYPDSQDAGNRTLRPMDEASGWLAEPMSYKDGWARIHPYATYPADRPTASWLPNRRIAYIFRAYASYRKATDTAILSSGAGPIDWGTSVTYTLSAPTATWTSIEFFEGDRLLRRATPADGDALAVATAPIAPGYSVYHAVVTFADGTQRTTFPRRVFVRAGPPQPPVVGPITAIPAAVQPGDSATLTASVAGYPIPSCQWRKDGVNLVNGGNVSGATNTTLVITNVQAGDAGSYTFVATNTVSSATSAAVQLALQAAPPTVTTQPQGQTVTAGANATFTMAVNGYPAPACQWQRRPAGANAWEDLHEGGSYHGTTTATLMVTAPTVAMSGDQFRCVITNATGLATSTAVTLTINGAGVLQYPVGIAADSAGNLYVADSSGNTIRKITPAGVVSTLAGSIGAVGTQDGTGADARFNQPGGLAVDAAGNVFVADTANATIRKITPAGVVTTVAGSAANRGNRDGVGTAAWFNSPHGIAVDATGNLYVADALNHTIRKISPDGMVSTLAGAAGAPGDADGAGSAARFNYPSGIATDNRQIYVADTYNATIRRITLDGVVTTVVGSAGISGVNDGTGIYALFNQPAGVAVDPASDAGNFYVADTGNGTIRRVTQGGIVTTQAGVAGIAGLGDGTGGNALFNQPRGLVVDGNRNLWVADTGNGAIRKVTPNGVVTTLALTADTPTTPPPSSGTTPPPATGTTTSGGGGAMEAWFAGALAVWALIRWAVRKR